MWRRFGDYGYPEILIYSVNLEDYHFWRSENRWDRVAEGLIASVKSLERAGAEVGLIATNTMHKVFDAVSDAVSIPLIHIIDAAARQAGEKGMKSLGLLGTRYTMQDGFLPPKARPSRHSCLDPLPRRPGDHPPNHRHGTVCAGS